MIASGDQLLTTVRPVGQDVIMFPEETGSKSKVLPVLIAVLLFLLVAGGASWFYFNTRTPASQPVTTTSTPATPVASTDPVIVSAATVTAAISDLDAQLAQIDNDLKSTDDTIPTL